MPPLSLAAALRQREAVWRSFLATHLPGAVTVAVGRSDGDRRVLRLGNEAIKVARRPVPQVPDRRPLLEEHRTVQRLADLGLVPASRFEEHLDEVDGTRWQVLAVPWHEGERAADAGGRLRAGAVVRAVAALNRRGVAHGDLNPGNVLVAPDGSVRLVDYERAWFGHPVRVAVGDLTGRWLPPGQPARPLVRMLVELSLLPGARALAPLRRGRSESGRRPVETLVGRQSLGGSAELTDAWLAAARAAGGGLPYGFELSGCKYRGEWSWATVWESIRAGGSSWAGRRLTEVTDGLPLGAVWAGLEGALPDRVVVRSERLTGPAWSALSAFGLGAREVGPLGGEGVLESEVVLLSDPAAARRTLDRGERLLGARVTDLVVTTTAADRGAVVARLRALGFVPWLVAGLGTTPLPVVHARRVVSDGTGGRLPGGDG